MALENGPIHQQFLDDSTPQIDLEGARYSAKTWTCCQKVLKSAKRTHPGIRWLACRYSNEETKTKIKTVLQYEVAPRMGIDLTWSEDEKAFTVPTTAGDSKVFCHGLKAQSRQEELAKVRGLDMGGIWNDQSEELPEGIAQELPFGTRQEGYPHQVILSPNPPTEDHFLADMFPEECLYTVPAKERMFPHRVYYRLSLYDNPHCPKDKLAELEAQFPPTHVKYKSLIMGQRGPNVTGLPVYDGVFSRKEHVLETLLTPHTPILEAIHAGQHHPVWTVSQRTPFGIVVLAGLMGKRMFLEDFLPVVDFYRDEWFTNYESKLCSDPPPSEDAGMRYTHLNILRDIGLKPVWRVNANAPDVRESVIQHIASLMRRRGGNQPALVINQDSSKFLMVSPVVTKQTRLLVDGCEGSYVWDENFVSVGNKKVRQPKSDQWVDGWQRCLENTVLNFSTVRMQETQRNVQQVPVPRGPNSWMA